MVGFERRHRIGELLGLHLAHCEEGLSADPEDEAALEKIRSISDTYRNFTTGGMPGFQDDFDHGYELGKWEIEQDARLAPQFLTGDPSTQQPK